MKEVRICMDCPADISERRLNSPRCVACAKRRKNELGNASQRKMYRQNNPSKVGNCLMCGGEIIASRNKSGYCGRNPECKKMQNKYSQANRFTWILPDDGIVDDEAVRIAAHEIRPVQLTPTERLEVVRKMVRLQKNAVEIAKAIHVTPNQIRGILDLAGFEMIRDPHTSFGVNLILPKDRCKKKMLETTATRRR